MKSIQFNPGIAGYLITLSARASTLGGIVRPICFALNTSATAIQHVHINHRLAQDFVPRHSIGMPGTNV
jgi:hypothetical protein